MADEHEYTSTACAHDRHVDCRVTCKWCLASCRCPCHTPPYTQGDETRGAIHVEWRNP